MRNALLRVMKVALVAAVGVVASGSPLLPSIALSELLTFGPFCKESWR